MARIIFTQSATELAKRLIQEMPEYDEPTVSIVAVVWSNGARDNRRGPTGEVVWEVTEPPGWKAVAAPWGETPDVPTAEHVTEIQGVPVFVDPRARSAPGKLLVSTRDGELFVEHQAT
jgi:hypothetical protein